VDLAPPGEDFGEGEKASGVENDEAGSGKRRGWDETRRLREGSREGVEG
jgi:hypothetical protein